VSPGQVSPGPVSPGPVSPGLVSPARLIVPAPVGASAPGPPPTAGQRRDRRLRLAAGLVAVALCVAAVTWQVVRPASEAAGEVRIDQMQSFGTHNSYHLQISDRELQVARLADSSADQLEYQFPPLGDQLRAGLRVLELDLYPDPIGGLYSDPLLRRLTGLGTLPGLGAPGTKVLHIADVDYRSTCATLVACLRQLVAFDRADPGHSPVFVLLELKNSDDRIERLGGVRSPPWDATALATLDAEIAGQLGDAVITPDDIRRPGLTLEQSVLAGGWPTLAQARGRTLFAFDNGPGPARDAYLAGHPGLVGREVFTNAEPGDADAVFLLRDDPTGSGATDIADLVRRGYLVRTRADDGPADPDRLAAARASGAQLVSTDHPDALGGVVPAGPDGGLVGCDPVSAPSLCPAGLGRAAP